MVVAMFFSLCAVLGFYIGRLVGLMTDPLHRFITKEDFSINKFLSDPVIIVLGIGIIILSVICSYYWNKINRKNRSS